MSELFGRMDESASMAGEMLKALVGKVMDLWALVKENMDQVRKLSGQVEEMRAMKEQMIQQENRIEEFIQKATEIAVSIRLATGKFDLPVERVKQLEKALEYQVNLFERPLDKTVRHHHFLGKAIAVLFGLGLVSSIALSMLVWQWQRADSCVAKEMKWRAVKLMTDPAVTKAVDQVDSSSEADPKAFARSIEGEEDRREDLTKNLLREQEARKRIDELEKQAKK